MDGTIINTVNKETTIKAVDLAEYLLTSKVKNKAGIPAHLTHLTVHKVLYFIQGYHLLETGKELFSENFRVHPSGYIIPEVWDVYQKYGYKSILFVTSDLTEDDFSQESQTVLTAVLESYGRLDGKTLEELIHQEDLYWEKKVGDLASKQDILTEFQTNYEPIVKGRIA